MERLNSSDKCRTIAFVIFHDFSMIAFSSSIEPIRLANQGASADIYTWKVYSVDGQPVRASNGSTIVVDGSVEEIQSADMVIICSGVNVEKLEIPAFVPKKLRYLASHGSAIGAVCTGTYILAKCGLMKGYRCTIHWENMKAFTEEFPEIEASPLLFDVDSNRFTCAGGTAAVDMMLHVVGEHHGQAMVGKIADMMMHHRIRLGDEPQRLDLRVRLGVSHPKLLGVIKQMEDNLETPMSCGELATSVGLSARQLERLFNKYIGVKPSRFYLKLRLNQARLLLRQTSQPIINVALACGFVSASHFTKCYHEQFSRTPSEERRIAS